MRKPRDKMNIIGEQYGRLTVREEVSGGNPRMRYYRCACECGNVRIVTQSNLRSGNTQSCGCYKGHAGSHSLKKRD